MHATINMQCILGMSTSYCEEQVPGVCETMDVKGSCRVYLEVAEDGLPAHRSPRSRIVCHACAAARFATGQWSLYVPGSYGHRIVP